ncbi:MAG: chloride channel protein [Erysipelotrichaceae bacterium]|nr:chloride channel protein [Erysipelotrichaceae bacterium]MDD4642406.1 chloride channel protein [Erysipelotrichaceae bacterium]
MHTKEVLNDLGKMKWDITIKGIIIGVIVGLIVSFYRIVIEYGFEFAIIIYSGLRNNPIFIPFWLVILIIVAYISYRLMRLEPFAKGSGIPQVEGIVLLGFKMKWHTVLLVRYIVGFLTSIFGLSLGREGPSIQIGAAGALALAENSTNNKLKENYLVTAGASAGLAAAFNAPLSGVIFALEEVHRTFSPNILIATTTAALTADIIAKYFFGLNPVLSYTNVYSLPINYYFLLIILGVLTGFLGTLVNKGLLLASDLYDKIPEFYRLLIALSIAMIIGLFLPQVLGGGQNLIKLSENAEISITMALLLLIIKMLFTFTSFGSGVPGGIFMPILATGALVGTIFGQLLTSFNIPVYYVSAFCVCAMAGMMSSSVKSPVTSVILMAEMTGSLIHLLPVAIVAFISLLTSDLLRTVPIYEVLLEEMNKDDKSIDHKKNGAIIEVSVELGSEVAGKKIKDINWPDNILIVAINRGKKEIVPNGENQIIQGDYLIVMSYKQDFESTNSKLIQLCHTN